MATQAQVSWIAFQAPAPLPGVPVDPTDPCFGKQPWGCGCGCASCVAGPKGPQAPCCSSQPVRYGSGEVVLTVADLHADGYGVPWGQTRSFASRLTQPTNAGNGYNWQVKEWTYLVVQDSGTVVVMGDANAVLWFDPAPGGGYLPRFSVRQSLLLDAVNNVYELVDLDGSITRYNASTGAFLSHADPAGNQVAVVSYVTNGFNFSEVQRSFTDGSGNKTVESYLYTWQDPTAQYPLLSSVLLRRQVNGGAWANVQQVLYSYYGSGDPTAGRATCRR